MANIASFDRIPLATSYPWGPDENPARRPSIRPECGTGLTELRKRMQRSDTGERAKEILDDLLDGEDLTLPASAPNSKDEPNTDECYTIDIDHNMKEDEILALADEGKVSLFGSILRIIDENKTDQPISTRHILRTCCLAIRPGDVPPHMDCKEMVMAALHFLASNSDTGSSEDQKDYLVAQSMLNLPLIHCMQEDVDLEKRVYEKHTAEDAKSWSLSDAEFRRKLRWIERTFTSSFSYSKPAYLSRENFCPRLSKEDEKLIVFKGTLPAAASGSSRSKAAATARKRKAAATPTPSESTGAAADTYSGSPQGVTLQASER